MRNLAPSLLCLVLSSACLAQTTNWVEVKPKNSPPRRTGHAMAYDAARQRTVLFGGWDGSKCLGDTWEYDGKNWAQMKPSRSPSIRCRHVMAYDSVRRLTVLFGGTSRNDTWEYDGKNWTQVKPKNMPPKRYDAAMAFDSIRARMVLFGGWDGSKFLGDTWEWDGKNWTQVVTKNAPLARRNSGMAYDLARLRIVLFSGSHITDTWEYDGLAGTWRKMKPKSSPSGRAWMGIAYDLARKRTVLFGGSAPFGWGELNDTWEWDGANWTLLKPTTRPVARVHHFMVYDQRRKRMVVFGGVEGNPCFCELNDTWELVSQTLTGSPPTISIATGGTHAFGLHAGTANASRLYWIFGSVTGTSPGVPLASAAGSVTIPLVPDFYTAITIAQPNSALLRKTKGTLDASGQGQASLVVPKINDPNAIGVTLYHAYLVYDASSNFYVASNPVTLRLVK